MIPMLSMIKSKTNVFAKMIQCSGSMTLVSLLMNIRNRPTVHQHLSTKKKMETVKNVPYMKKNQDA